MNKIVFLVLLTLFSNTCLADCDFSTLVHNSDGTVTYSKAAHICVGQTVQDNKTKTLTIQDLTQAISLKDVALKAADARATAWMDTSLKLESNIQSIDKNVKSNEWLVFGLGCLATMGAGYTFAKLAGH